MAQMEIDFPEDLLGGLLSQDTEELCREMVDAAVPIMEECMKKEVRSVIGHGGDSELVKSIKGSRARVSRNNAVISFVGPKGNSSHHYGGAKKNRKRKVSNALKAVWLNYGRRGQPARPFLNRATKNAEKKVLEKMQEVYDRRTGGADGR